MPRGEHFLNTTIRHHSSCGSTSAPMALCVNGSALCQRRTDPWAACNGFKDGGRLNDGPDRTHEVTASTVLNGHTPCLTH